MDISRRRMVAALAVAPVMASTPASATFTGRRDFDALIAAHQKIRAEWDAHPFGNTLHDHPDHARLEEEDKALMYLDCDARDAIIDFPAPDHRAVAQKIDFMIKDWMMDGSEQSHAYLQALASDVRRLGGVA